MFLAGTVIFGGGPVVIPLLREYVVEPGWVSSRDFLLGLAIIQAMPGPNFNFAVYLGALAMLSGNTNRSVATTLPGAILAFIGIFTPGLFLSIGFQSVWRALRKRPEVVSVLRGVNAAAVGFVFTAVYRLWEIGYLTKESARGTSLGREPWWLLVASATFTAVEWFSVPPPAAILGGGVAGLGWWGAVGRS
jgi:chromate transport protein ChrA